MIKLGREMFALLLMLLMASTLANPGVKLRLTAKGIQFANKVTEAELNKALRTVTIPNQSDGGKFSWEVNNITPRNIRGPNTEIQLNPGSNGLTLRVFNFGVDVHADWKIQYRIIFKIRASGSVDACFNGVSLTATIAVGEQNGRPSLRATSCSFNVDNISFKLHGGLVAWVGNMFRGKLQDKLKGILQSKACDMVNKQINGNANDRLQKLKVQVNLGPKFLLDYGLFGNPLVTGSFLESNHKGVVYWREAFQESPVPPPVFPHLTDVSKMLYVVLTDYSFNTFAYQAHKNNFLTYNIGLNNIPSEFVDLLNPTTQIGTKYPNAKLEFRICSAKAPTITTQEGQLTLLAVGNVDVVVTAGGTAPENILTLEVSVSLAIRPALDNCRLIACIGDQSSLKLKITRSTVGPIDDMTELNTKINELLKNVIIPALNAIGSKGLDLPVTGNVRLIGPVLDVKQGGLVVGTDVDLI